MRRALDAGPLSHGVREGDGELDYVGAALDEGGYEAQRVFHAGMADGEEGDEAGSTLGPQTGERIGYATHVATPETPKMKATRLNKK